MMSSKNKMMQTMTMKKMRKRSKNSHNQRKKLKNLHANISFLGHAQKLKSNVHLFIYRGSLLMKNNALTMSLINAIKDKNAARSMMKNIRIRLKKLSKWLFSLDRIKKKHQISFNRTIRIIHLLRKL